MLLKCGNNTRMFRISLFLYVTTEFLYEAAFLPYPKFGVEAQSLSVDRVQS